MNLVQSILIPCLIIVVVALLMIWIVEKFIPEFSYPARLIIGVGAIIFVITKLLPLLH